MPVRSAGYVVVSSGLLVAYLVVSNDLTAGFLWLGLQVGTFAAIIVGIVHHRPATVLPWWLFAGALLALTVPGLIDPYFWTATASAFHHPAAIAFAGIGITLVGVAATRMARAQSGGRDRGSLLDSAILTIACTAVLWEIALGRFGTPDVLSLEPRSLVLGIAALGSWVAARMVQLHLAGGKRALSGWLVLSASLLVLSGAATLVVTGIGDGIPPVSSLLWGAGHITIGLSALHPSMIVLGRPTRLADTAHVRIRSLLLALALLAPPTAILLRFLATGETAVVSAVATALLTPVVVLRFVDLLRDAERAHREAEFQMLHDPLTELPNRRLLDERLDQALQRRTDPDHQVAVLFLDLNGFKAINDAHGHAAGDHLLIETAHRLQTVSRAADTVARFAGDEFVVVLEDVTPTAASDAAERIHTALTEPIQLATTTVTVGASIGIALSHQVGHDPEALLSAADKAMYRAKAHPQRTIETAAPNPVSPPSTVSGGSSRPSTLQES